MSIKELETRIEYLENFIKEKTLKKKNVPTAESNQVMSTAETNQSAPAKTKRAPSQYNIHVQTEIARMRKEMGSSFNIKEAFTIAVQTWNAKKTAKQSVVAEETKKTWY